MPRLRSRIGVGIIGSLATSIRSSPQYASVSKPNGALLAPYKLSIIDEPMERRTQVMLGGRASRYGQYASAGM